MVWAIWKSKIKISIQNQDVTPNETTQILKGLLTDLVIKSWNTAHFMEEDKKLRKQKKPRKLWAKKNLTKFDPLAGPCTDQPHIKGCSRNTGEGGI